MLELSSKLTFSVIFDNEEIKGQLILEGNFGVLDSPKRNEIFWRISALKYVPTYLVTLYIDTQRYWVHFFVKPPWKNWVWRKEIQWKVRRVFIFLHQKSH